MLYSPQQLALMRGYDMNYPTQKELAVERLAYELWRDLPDRSASVIDVTKALAAAIEKAGVDVGTLEGWDDPDYNPLKAENDDLRSEVAESNQRASKRASRGECPF